ncbi:MAG: hypothetical protein WCI04_03175 [archaeon]
MAFFRKSKSKRYNISLSSGRKKRVNTSSHFLRTGRVKPGFNYAEAEKLGARFLSREWMKQSRKNEGVILPAFKERLIGRKLLPKEKVEVRKQTNFALMTFCRT